MQITVASIDLPEIQAQNDEVRLARFQVDFVGDRCSGSAYLVAVLSHDNIDFKAIQRNCGGRVFDWSIGFGPVSDYQVISGHGQDRLVYLGQRGHFLLEGRIVEHLFTGEGLMFQVFDDRVMLHVSQLSSDSLRVDPGAWVTFKTTELVFMLLG